MFFYSHFWNDYMSRIFTSWTYISQIFNKSVNQLLLLQRKVTSGRSSKLFPRSKRNLPIAVSGRSAPLTCVWALCDSRHAEPCPDLWRCLSCCTHIWRICIWFLRIEKLHFIHWPICGAQPKRSATSELRNKRPESCDFFVIALTEAQLLARLWGGLNE